VQEDAGVETQVEPTVYMPVAEPVAQAEVPAEAAAAYGVSQAYVPVSDVVCEPTAVAPEGYQEVAPVDSGFASAPAASEWQSTGNASGSEWQSSDSGASGAYAAPEAAGQPQPYGAPVQAEPVEPQPTYAPPMQAPPQGQPQVGVGAQSYTPQPAAQPAQYGGYQAPQQGQQAAPQPYGGYQAPVQTYQPEPPKKSKNFLIFVLIGVLVVAIAGLGIYLVTNRNSNQSNNNNNNQGNNNNNNQNNNNTTVRGWIGGSTSSELPRGFVAIVDNEYVTIGVGEPYFYAGDSTVYVEMIVINRSENAIWLAFDDNYFDGSYADLVDVWTDIMRTEPGTTSEGVIWIDVLHDVEDLNNWRGTVYVVDDDSYETDDWPVILDSYNFNITYQH